MTLRRRSVPALLLGAALAARASAQPTPGAPEIPGEQAQRDLRILQRAFNELHPGLHRFATPADIDAEFAAAHAAVKGGATRAEMLLTVSRLAAAVQCGHTWTNPANQGPAVRALFARGDKLPVALRWVEGRVLITGSADAAVKPGSELLAIDGRPMAGIRDALLPMLRADGRHEGAWAKRLSQLDSGTNGGAMDRLFPLLYPPQGGRYRLRLLAPGATQPADVEVAAITQAARDQAVPPEGAQWSFRLDGEVAVLTLPTFAFWGQDFKADAFLSRTFTALRRVPVLIIDLRRNEGGADAIGRQLLGHLLPTPLEFPGHAVESAYERVPYVLARYLDTWDFGFFDRTGLVVKGPGRNWRLPDAPPTRVEPREPRYAGRVIALVGPQNSSAGFLLARDFKRTAAATLVGQPTGGHLRGLNGGQLAWITLPASGVAVDIPLLAAIHPGDPPDSGVLPDVRVAPSFADAAAGRDTEMQAAFELIARWPGRSART